MKKKNKIFQLLITGTAGFVGFHLTKRLLDEGHEIIGLDNINDYYDVNLKFARLQEAGIKRENIIQNKYTESSKYPLYKFIKLDLADRENMYSVFQNNNFDLVINLAAQAGVRYSLENPYTYTKSNIDGFLNILEGCRHHGVQNLMYASSSSVYGGNTKFPFSETDSVDNPVSLYAATKKSNELMAHVYAHLFGINTIGLRFFTVYGPWGRPDMAVFSFPENIMNEQPIEVYNYGKHVRSFTYIDDIIEGIVQLIDKNNSQELSTINQKYKVFNIGGDDGIELMDFIKEIENVTGKKAIIKYKPLQPGDMEKTIADTSKLNNETGFIPKTKLKTGLENFVKWFEKYYRTYQ